MTGNKRAPQTCTFCSGIAGGIFHSNKTMFPLKNSYGDCIEIDKVGKAKVGDDIGTIFDGKHSLFYSSTWSDFSHQKYIDDALPRGTKQIQIKSFSVKDNKEYLLCTFYDQHGQVLQIQEGTKKEVYENMFLSRTAATQHLARCDCIFYKSLKKVVVDIGRTSTTTFVSGL